MSITKSWAWVSLFEIFIFGMSTKGSSLLADSAMKYVNASLVK